MRSPAANAELALHLEAAAAPTPGNVDRDRDHDDLRFEHFLAGAVGARDGLSMAATDESIGAAFERAVEGMSQQSGGNTQFGALLLLIPLVRAAASDDGLTPTTARQIVEQTTVDDAAAFYRAFDHVDVRVDDPPDSFEPLDVRRGSTAIPALRERELTLQDVLAASADRDGVAREWTNGFKRSFETASRLAGSSDGGPVDGQSPVETWIVAPDRLADRAARAHLALLAEQPDSLIVTAHDESTAASVRRRARELLSGLPEQPPEKATIETFAADLVDRGVNPGMTADLLAAGLFIALETEAVSV